MRLELHVECTCISNANEAFKNSFAYAKIMKSGEKEGSNRKHFGMEGNNWLQKEQWKPNELG